MKDISGRQLEIIEAAGRILTKHGLSGLTTKNLAKEMGFSEAAIYRHFASKEAIIVAMLEFLGENMDQRLGMAIDSNLSSEEKFRTLFKNQFNFFSTNPHFVVAVFSDGLLEESDKINHAILNIMQVKMKHLMPIVSEGQQNGSFTQLITPDELVHIIMGSFRLQMFKWRISNFQFDIKRNGQNMLEALLTLIKS